MTIENFSSKVCTCDYVGDGNYYANFCENRFSGGISPNTWNITPLWLFWLSCPVLSFFRSCAQVEPLDRFHALWLKRTCFRARSASWCIVIQAVENNRILIRVLHPIGVNKFTNPRCVDELWYNEDDSLPSLTSQLKPSVRSRFVQVKNWDQYQLTFDV